MCGVLKGGVVVERGMDTSPLQGLVALALPGTCALLCSAFQLPRSEPRGSLCEMLRRKRELGSQRTTMDNPSVGSIVAAESET